MVACLQHGWAPWFPSPLYTRAGVAACSTAPSHVADSWLHWLTEYYWSQAMSGARSQGALPPLLVSLRVLAHREANCYVRSASTLKPPCCEETQASHVEGSGGKRRPLTTSIWGTLRAATLSSAGLVLWKRMINFVSHCIVDLLYIF